MCQSQHNQPNLGNIISINNHVHVTVVTNHNDACTSYIHTSNINLFSICVLSVETVVTELQVLRNAHYRKVCQ